MRFHAFEVTSKVFFIFWIFGFLNGLAGGKGNILNTYWPFEVVCS